MGEEKLYTMRDLCVRWRVKKRDTVSKKMRGYGFMLGGKKMFRESEVLAVETGRKPKPREEEDEGSGEIKADREIIQEKVNTEARVELKKVQKQEAELDGWLGTVEELRGMRGEIERMLTEVEDKRKEAQEELARAIKSREASEAEITKARGIIRQNEEDRASIEKNRAKAEKLLTQAVSEKERAEKQMAEALKMIKDFNEGLAVPLPEGGVVDAVVGYFESVIREAKKEGQDLMRMSDLQLSVMVRDGVEKYNKKFKVVLKREKGISSGD